MSRAFPLVVKPRDVLAETLMRRLPAEGPDVVLIRVEFEGANGEERKKIRYDIVDYFDEKTGLSAMMRTTALPASIIAQMMARREVRQKEQCHKNTAFHLNLL